MKISLKNLYPFLAIRYLVLWLAPRSAVLLRATGESCKLYLTTYKAILEINKRLSLFYSTFLMA